MPHEEYANLFNEEDEVEEEDDGAAEENIDEEIFEVSEVHDVRYDDKETGPGLYFKVFNYYFVYFLHLILKLMCFLLLFLDTHFEHFILFVTN